jgi:hypothetical protein
LICESSKLFESTRELIEEAIHALVERAVDSGDIRPDIEPFVPDWPQSAKRLVDIQYRVRDRCGRQLGKLAGLAPGGAS